MHSSEHRRCATSWLASVGILFFVSLEMLGQSAFAQPSEIVLKALVRDFYESHPDFQAPHILYPGREYTAYLVEPTLGADMKPIYNNGLGWAALASPTTNTLRDVHFFTQFKGWIVGDGGVIFFTNDGGASWTPRGTGTVRDMNAIQVLDNGKTGWVVGDDGEIYKTTNGGWSWTQQALGITVANLFDVHFPVDDQVGYAVGGAGAVLKTSNSGTLWSVLPTPMGVRLNGCWFIDASKGFVAGDGGALYMTDDGGSTWTPMVGPPGLGPGGVNMWSVQFVSNVIGYASGASGALFRTDNGGTSWSALATGSPAALRSLHFPVGANVGYAVGSGGNILNTDDGGATWSSQSMGGMWFNGVHFASATVGYAVGSGGSVVRMYPAGAIITAQFQDSSGNNIAPQMYNPGLGDVAGTIGPATDGAIESQATFDQWYNDILGVNISTAMELTLPLQFDGTYRFDSTDPPYVSLGGLYPINDMLFGNSPVSPGTNHHFTIEAHWDFVFDASASHFFSFTGDDDVFVYINGQLVIDVGGRHWPKEQTIDLDRLGLTDGDTYRMHFFYAERLCCGSNLRITTNLPLVSNWEPTVTAPSD